MNINHLKDRNSYRKVKHEGESLKGYEASKIVNGVKRETNNQFIWQVLPFVLLIAFVIVAIILLVSGG